MTFDWIKNAVAPLNDGEVREKTESDIGKTEESFNTAIEPEIVMPVESACTELYEIQRRVSSSTCSKKTNTQKTLQHLFIEVLRDTAERSSIHGFPSFASPTVHWIIKLIWLVAVGASWGYLIFQINNSFDLFNSHKVFSSISVVYESPTDFFAVDVCNLNPMSERFNYEYLINKTAFGSNNSYSTINFVDSGSVYMQIFLEFAHRTGNLSLYKSGIALSDMLVSCEYQGKKCSVDDFYWYHDFNYGNCYRFNGGSQAQTQTYGPGLTYTSRPVEKTYQSGWRYGLRMELFSPSARLLAPLNYKSGFRITVHNQSRDIYLEEDGFDVPLGFETNVAVTKTFIDRLSQPYSNCIDQLTDEIATHSQELRVIKDKMDSGEMQAYQRSFCLKACFQYYMLERCNCSYPYYVYLNIAPLYEICFGSDQVDCMNKALDYFGHSSKMEECVNACPAECKTSKYDTRITTANYPTKWYASFVNRSQTLFSLGSVFKTANITYDLIHSSTAFVSIYYDSMEYTLIQESPTFTFDLLLANIGGNLGLFTGMSILSFVEFLEALVSILIVAFFFKNKKTPYS